MLIRTKFPPRKGTHVGRKGHYHSDINHQAYLLALLGARDADLAEFWDVAQSTVDYWKEHREGFRDALHRGKRDADARVAKALLDRALGYSVTERETTTRTDAKGNIYTSEKTTVKHITPDVTAQIFWLCNRWPSLWHNVNRTEVQGNVDVTMHSDKIDLDGLSADEQTLIKRVAMRQINTIRGVRDN